MSSVVPILRDGSGSLFLQLEPVEDSSGSIKLQSQVV